MFLSKYIKILSRYIFPGRRRKLKQYALFEEAIKEVFPHPKPNDLRVHHPTAKCYYRDLEYPILFPLRFLRECRQLDYNKKYNFCFRGLYTPKREWVKDFSPGNSMITFTEQGRKIPKQHFDVPYYQEMANSYFTLCPQGDYKWTYRFLEAILCRSIPVIEPGAEHEQCDGFKFFYSNEAPQQLLSKWNEDILSYNYQLFLRRHTLIDRFIFH